MDKDARNRKHGRSTILGKRKVFRLDLNESRAGFCWLTETPSLSPDSNKPTSSCELEFSRLRQMTGIFSNEKI